MSDPTLVLVAHGTRSPVGVATVARLAELVADRIGPVRVAFVDVLGPTPSEVLSEIDGPAVLMPAFLASGYHVRVDLPEHVRLSGRDDVRVTAALGPDPALADVMMSRLRSAGWRSGDHVVLAAAGSSDPDALADVATAAAHLAERIGAPVDVGYAATATPTVADAVSVARAGGARRVVVAAYLLAPGLFHTRLSGAGADAVTEPLGADDALADLVAARFRTHAAALTAR
ncbi:sirohydrochlorin chelatase [Williamsia deligens]|uniref:Sirohydrochlorin chelatase n=1 Tax=Williamsia deligens TaxID=321325 RepID=A0ABW3G148_9NOCA|nr:sirohydrochlorin chelatase [Williamsia deligens]MCP2194835.1 Sirohydrochlorin ferrochelatase [Williamsia deligens]